MIVKDLVHDNTSCCDGGLGKPSKVVLYIISISSSSMIAVAVVVIVVEYGLQKLIHRQILTNIYLEYIFSCLPYELVTCLILRFYLF